MIIKTTTMTTMEDTGFEPMILDDHSSVYLRTKLIFLSAGIFSLPFIVNSPFILGGVNENYNASQLHALTDLHPANKSVNGDNRV